MKKVEEASDIELQNLATLEKERNLSASELVLKGRYIQLGSGMVIPDYREAQMAFQAALDIDKDYVPALLELGWFHYAVQDDGAMALPFFERALEISLAQVKEAIKGKMGCLEDLESSKAAKVFLRDTIRKLIKVEDFAEESVAPVVAPVKSRRSQTRKVE